MASSGNRTLCSTCNMRPISVTCDGCKNSFCDSDYTQHKKDLQKELEKQSAEIEAFSTTLNQTTYQSHSLTSQIDKWKNDSIAKINAAAEAAVKAVEENLRLLFDDLKDNTKDMGRRIESSIQNEEHTHHVIDGFKAELAKYQQALQNPSNIELLRRGNDQSQSIPLIHVKHQTINKAEPLFEFSSHTRWESNGRMIAGPSNPTKDSTRIELDSPFAICCDHTDGTIYVTDQKKHQIVAFDTITGHSEIVAGGKGEGNGSDQLANPTAAVIDYRRRSLIIADWGNRRVLRWSLQKGAEVEILVTNTRCTGLAIDKHGNIYASDAEHHCVQQHTVSGSTTTVAGLGGGGNALHQLNSPTNLFIDGSGALYISDLRNARVVKWEQGAREGVIVAGGGQCGSRTSQLQAPRGLYVDASGSLYVVDQKNNCVMRWCEGDTEGTVIVGGNGYGSFENQFQHPCDLSFDRARNLYVADAGNHRVQMFNVMTNSHES